MLCHKKGSVKRWKKFTNSVTQDKSSSRNGTYKVIKKDRFSETVPGKDSVRKYCGLANRNRGNDVDKPTRCNTSYE